MRMLLHACLLMALVPATLGSTPGSKSASTTPPAGVNQPTGAVRMTGNGRTSLHEAALKGQGQLIENLIADGADPNVRARDGATPLHCASTAAVARILVKAGAKVNAVTRGGDLPIHYIIKNGPEYDVVSYYLSKGISPDVPTQDDRSDTPLILAAERHKMDTAKLLLSKGAKVNKRNSYGSSPLYKARYDGAGLEMAKLLIAKGADVNARDSDGDTPLHQAWDDDITDIVELLIAHGANPNARNNDGETPLHVVAEKGSAKLAEVLLKRGARIEEKDNEGNTPLILASGRQFDYENTEVAKFLISKGANPNAKNSYGESPLHKVYQEDLASALLKAGANPMAKDNSGLTPLHIVGWASIAELYVAAGADVNAKDQFGATPLHSVASRGNKDMAEFLLKHGADVNAKDKEGHTPLQYCSYKMMADVIRKYGGK